LAPLRGESSICAYTLADVAWQVCLGEYGLLAKVRVTEPIGDRAFALVLKTLPFSRRPFIPPIRTFMPSPTKVRQGSIVLKKSGVEAAVKH